MYNCWLFQTSKRLLTCNTHFTLDFDSAQLTFRKYLTNSRQTRQCQSSVTGSKSPSLSQTVSPSIVCLWAPTCLSHVSWSPPDKTLPFIWIMLSEISLHALHDVYHITVFCLILKQNVKYNCFRLLHRNTCAEYVEEQPLREPTSR